MARNPVPCYNQKMARTRDLERDDPETIQESYRAGQVSAREDISMTGIQAAKRDALAMLTGRCGVVDRAFASGYYSVVLTKLANA